MVSQTNEAALETHIDNALAKDGPIIAAVLAALPRALALYAFGSRMQGTARSDSDLDLAVLVAGYAEPLALWALASKLADTVGCAVDLLDLRAASTVMQYQVLTQGRRLWARQPDAGLFECFVMSEKAELDVARAGLLADISKEGTVYGG